MRGLIRRVVMATVVIAAAVPCALWATDAAQRTRARVPAPARATAAVAAGPYDFAGTVYLPNGQPARNITLRGAAARMAGNGMDGRRLDQIATDGQGRYRLRFPTDKQSPKPAGATYALLLYSPQGLGYVEVGRSWRGVVPQAPLDLHLQEGDRVTGRVVGYPGSQPMAGVKVQAIMEGPGGGLHWWVWPEQTTTDAEGRFRLKVSLPPKRYDVIAEPAVWPTMETVVEPPPSEMPAARRVEIRLVKPYTLHGHAYGPDGKPLRKSKVELFRYNEVTTDASGAFAFSPRVWSSPYRGPKQLGRYLTLVPKLASGEVARPTVVDATEPATQTVEVHFAAPATITGRQVDAHTGKPAVGVRATVIPVTPGVPPQQWEWLQDGVFDKEHSTIKDDETGKLVLRRVPPGEYWLQFESWTIQERTAENGKAARVTVTPGKTLDVGTTRLAYVPYLRGKYSGLTWPPDPSNNEEETHGMLRPSGSTSPGKEGYFDLWAGGGKYTLWATGLPSGTYDAVLVASHSNRRYVTQVLHNVALQEDVPREGVDLHFTRGASIRGKVVQPNGKPVADMLIDVRPVSGDALVFHAMSIYGHGPVMIYPSGRTDRTGAFLIDGLLAGEYELKALVEPAVHGAAPTVRVPLGATEQKRGVVLRTRR